MAIKPGITHNEPFYSRFIKQYRRFGILIEVYPQTT